MKTIYRSLSRGLALFCLTLVANIAQAATEAKPPVTPPAPAAAALPAGHELNPADIETFFDGLVPLQIESNDIAGAAIAIVKDGKLIFAKGYGVADMKTRTPVSPETTLFRIGSVTKLFTWTSVMQLVEQGKLDLDADVNTYLDVKLPAPFGKPVTLRNLMTHRGGFQEAIKGLGAQNSGKVDLGKYIRNDMPDQIYEPGTTPSYSNYGAALAGYIVERVSGQPFDAYVEDHIYKPLGMTHTSIRQPLPKELQPSMSLGYNLASGDPMPFEIVNGYPAGSQSSSATDIAKFMIAHLSGGTLGDARILKPETTALMHDTVTALDPRQNGIALGFYEETRNGRRIIGHGGDSVVFHSDLHLIPSENLGFFVSYNSTGRGDSSARGPLWRKFLDRYFPGPALAPATDKSGPTAAALAGSYTTTRRAETSLIKAFTELSQATVTANADGTLQVDALTGLNGQPRRFEPLGGGVFREVNGQDRLIFKPDAKGRMMILTWGSGVVAFVRTPFSQSSLFYLLVFAVSSTILLLNLVFWPVAAFARWHYAQSLGWSGRDHVLRLAVMATSVALLALFGGILSVIVPRLNNPWTLDETLDASLHLFQYIGIAGAAGSLIALYNALQAWRNPLRGFLGRLKESAVALSCLAIVWFAWTMNLFDLSLRY